MTTESTFELAMAEYQSAQIALGESLQASREAEQKVAATRQQLATLALSDEVSYTDRLKAFVSSEGLSSHKESVATSQVLAIADEVSASHGQAVLWLTASNDRVSTSSDPRRAFEANVHAHLGRIKNDAELVVNTRVFGLRSLVIPVDTIRTSQRVSGSIFYGSPELSKAVNHMRNNAATFEHFNAHNEITVSYPFYDVTAMVLGNEAVQATLHASDEWLQHIMVPVFSKMLEQLF